MGPNGNPMDSLVQWIGTSEPHPHFVVVMISHLLTLLQMLTLNQQLHHLEIHIQGHVFIHGLHL
jgi:hypothetical protein